MAFRSSLLGTVIGVISASYAGPIFAADLVPVRPPLIGSGFPTLMIMGGVCGAIWLARKVRERTRMY